jgi:hypothetical protein
LTKDELGIKVPELDSPEFIEGPKDELGIKVPELDSPEFIEGPKDRRVELWGVYSLKHVIL